MILLPFLNIEQLKKDAWAFAQDCCERWDVPTAAPEDLRDRRGRGLLTKDGYRITAMAVTHDFGWGYRSPAASLVAGLLPWAVILWFVALKINNIVTLSLAVVILFVAALAAYLTQLIDAPTSYVNWIKKVVILGMASFLVTAAAKYFFPSLGIGLGSLTETISSGSAQSGHHIANAFPFLVALFFAIIPWWKVRAEERERLLLLQYVGKEDNAAAAYPYVAEAATARHAQANRANEDKTPFFTLGKATGICSELLDLYAPDKGLPVGLTQHDSSTHFLTVGKTGTGKTAAIIRPFVQQWLKHLCGGLLLLDGKGDLPGEFAGTADYHIIEPGKVRLNLIEGLQTEDLVDVLTSYASTVGDNSHGGDHFWISSGETMLRSACILMEHCPAEAKNEFPWTLEALHRVVNQEPYRNNLLASYREIIDKHPQRAYLALAINYWTLEYKTMPPNTAGSVVGTVNSWLAPLMGHREIFEWCRSVDSDVNPALCLQGGRFGVNCPQYKYGSAGAMVSALIKARVYRAILQRGSGWRSVVGQTQVLVVADEAQEVITKTDSQMFPVGRSLGLVGLIGTQSIDELIARLGHERTYALLNNFRSFAAFQSSKLTMAWVSEQLGDVFRADFSKAKGIDIFRSAKGHNQLRQFKIPRHLVGTVELFEGMKLKDIKKDSDQGEKALEDVLTYTIGHLPLLSPAELSHFLNAPFQAVMQINRANVVRRDVVETTPVFC